MSRTPLYDVHKVLGARWVDFTGWEMPLSYSGVLDEHKSVRQAAGLFDISHMGRFWISGPDAQIGIQRILTRDVAKVSSGAARYSVICNEQGGILDDVVIYKKAADDFLLVVNAGNRQKIFNWCEKQFEGLNLRWRDRTRETAMLALQGPLVFKVLGESFKGKPWSIRETRLMNHAVTVAYTGYTGEPGVEIFMETASTGPVWQGLMSAGKSRGLKPIGLGARDTLRLEMGYALYGNDIDEGTTPLEADLGWVVDFSKPDFIGKQALQAQQRRGIARKLVGFKLTEPGVPRKGYGIYSDGKPIGTVTSGNISPMLNHGIGMGYVELGHADFKTQISIEIRKKKVSAVVVSRPFYKKSG